MHKGRGKLEWGSYPRIIVDINPTLVNYYRSLIPKYYCVSPQRYKPHITVIRGQGVEGVNDDYKTTWQQLAQIRSWWVYFEYSSEIKMAGPYFYLEAYSEDIANIRQRLGLSTYRNGFHSYHITLGNIKRAILYH